MCNFDTFSYILYFSGYTFDFESNIHQPPLDIEMGRQSAYVAKARNIRQSHRRKICAEYAYITFIFMTMFWTIPYTCYMSIRDGDINHVGRSLFQLIAVLQYYNGIKYFGQSHFYENIVSNSELMRNMKIIIPIITLVSLVLTLFNIILLGYGNNIHGYSDIYDNTNTVEKVLLIILCFFDSIYTYLTFTINACVFVINMIYHKNTVSAYSNSLINYIKNSMDTVQKLNIIAVEFSQMKDKFDQTVTCLTPFFTTLNFVGFVMIYFYLHAISAKIITPVEIVNMVLFCIVEVIYIAAIQKVNSNITNIADTISSNSVITTFFGNKRFNRTIPQLDEVVDEETDKSVYEVSYDDTYKDTCAVSQAVADENIRSPHTKKSHNYKDIDYDNMNKKIITIDNHIVKIHSMMKQNLIASISVDQMIDWIVLQGIVSDNWLTFRIFGIELTDSKVIARIFGIIVTLLVSTEVATLLNWW